MSKKPKPKNPKGRPIVHDITKLNKSIPAKPEDLARALFSVPQKSK